MTTNGSDRDHLLRPADEESGAPEGSWGDWFFFTGADHRMPFATIVEHDTPGFDEDSHLDRPGCSASTSVWAARIRLPARISAAGEEDRD
jgi:hypothetical protein